MIETQTLEVHHTEHGFDFLTFFFPTTQEANEFGRRVYNRLKVLDFEYMGINRVNLKHLPGDPAHFHTDGLAPEHWDEAHAHVHIIYPHKPTKEDWDYLYLHLNTRKVNVKFDRDLPTREVK